MDGVMIDGLADNTYYDKASQVFGDRFEFSDELNAMMSSTSQTYNEFMHKALVEFRIRKGWSKICLLRAKFEYLHDLIINKYIFQEVVAVKFIGGNNNYSPRVIALIVRAVINFFNRHLSAKLLDKRFVRVENERIRKESLLKKSQLKLASDMAPLPVQIEKVVVPIAQKLPKDEALKVVKANQGKGKFPTANTN